MQNVCSSQVQRYRLNAAHGRDRVEAVASPALSDMVRCSGTMGVEAGNTQPLTTSHIDRKSEMAETHEYTELTSSSVVYESLWAVSSAAARLLPFIRRVFWIRSFTASAALGCKFRHNLTGRYLPT
jgi:hypothetical protein